MRVPIQLALTYPERIASNFPRADLAALGALTFDKPDLARFPNLGLAYKATNLGGTAPCVLNAANEVVNIAFREHKCRFLQMSELISRAMEDMPFIAKPTYDDYVRTDAETRIFVDALLN